MNRFIYRKDNPSAASEATLDKYVSQVVEAVNAQSEKVILVGHSFGGMIISAVAEQIPNKIKCLVYVAAIVPQSGDNASECLSKDTQSAQNDFFRLSDDKTYTYLTLKNRYSFAQYSALLLFVSVSYSKKQCSK